MSIVKLENICKSYFLGQEEFPALKNINLTVHPGEFLGIIGTSGSGKSTLMNIMGLLDHASAGKYYLNDHDVFTFSEDELALMRNQMIGFVFQSFFLLPRMTVVENVSLPLLYRNESREQRREKAKEILKKVHLENFADRKPNQLSGGQQQRVAIARALIGHPHLLLADEPTGALDRHTRDEIMELFVQLNIEDNTTVVLITHEEKVAKFCRRIVRIEDGNLN